MVRIYGLLLTVATLTISTASGVLAVTKLPTLPAIDNASYSVSDFLGPDPDVIKKMKQIIEDWQGVPYLWGGNTKNGTDCSGFVQAVYRELGIKLPHGSKYLATCNVGPVVKGEWQYGDILIWPGHHAAIYTGNGTTAETVKGHVGRSRVGKRNPPIVRRFLDALCEIPEPMTDLQPEVSETPETVNMRKLIELMENGNIVKFAEEIKSNPSLAKTTDPQGANLLHWAADKGNVACVEILIAHGALVESKKDDGVTALHIASALGHDDVVSMLLSSGADPNAVDNRGRSPLTLARQKGNDSIISLLLDDQRTLDDNSTALASQDSSTLQYGEGEDNDDDVDSVPNTPVPETSALLVQAPPAPTAELTAPVLSDVEPIIPTRTNAHILNATKVRATSNEVMAMAPICEETAPDIEQVLTSEPLDVEAHDLLQKANEERLQHGMVPLTYDISAERVAQARAEYILDRDYMNQNKNNATTGDMLKRVGINDAKWCESVAMCDSLTVAQTSFIQAEKNDHKITNNAYVRAGIGVARGGQWGRVYVLLLLGS